MALPPGFQAPGSFPQLTARVTRANSIFLSNNAAGGTAGVAVTAGNSGGASGNAFDATGGSGVFSFDSTYLIHGPMSYLVTTGAVAAQKFVTWQQSVQQFPESPPGWPQWWYRFYFIPVQVPAAGTDNRLLAFFDPTAATICASLRLNTTMQLRWADTTNSIKNIMTTVLPTGQWVRVEGYVIGSPGSGQFQMQVYVGANVEGTVPDETLTSAATQNTFGAAGVIRWGQSASAMASYGPLWFSSLAVSTLGPIGPVGAGVSPPAPTQRIYSPPEPPGFVSPMAWQRIQFPRPVPAPPPAAPAPLYPLGHPVQARRLPQPGGRTSSRTGVYAQPGPPVRQLPGPVRAQPAVPLLTGRARHLSGPLGVLGPPVRQLQGPVRTRPQPPPPRGHVVRAAGVYAQAGPPVRQLQGPVGLGRRQPPPPARGRAASQRGPYAQTGPPVRQLRGPAGGQPQKPLLTGRTRSRAGAAGVAAPPPVPGTVAVTDGYEQTAAVLDQLAATVTVTDLAAGTVTVTDRLAGTVTVTDLATGTVTIGNLD